MIDLSAVVDPVNMYQPVDVSRPEAVRSARAGGTDISHTDKCPLVR